MNIRVEFRDQLKKRMEENDKIWLLLGGVGYGFWEEDFSKRVINCEASEVAMVDMAVGLALEGKIPFVYAITPHLYRAFEQVRNYLNYEKIPVHLVGVGRDKDYGALGFTHYAEDAKDIFSVFPNIEQYYPDTKEQIQEMLDKVTTNKKPSFINLRR